MPNLPKICGLEATFSRKSLRDIIKNLDLRPIREEYPMLFCVSAEADLGTRRNEFRAVIRSLYVKFYWATLNWLKWSGWLLNVEVIYAASYGCKYFVILPVSPGLMSPIFGMVFGNLDWLYVAWASFSCCYWRFVVNFLEIFPAMKSFVVNSL